MNNKFNKKGFTLTELIVVIVIIGILAAVLIPTLTGYINKAKNSAAEQEARPFVTAYTAWELEEYDTIQDINGFRKYCVELELVSEDDAADVILAVNPADDSVLIKASNNLYVSYKNGKYQIHEEQPIDLLEEMFFDGIVKPNIASINKEFLSGVAELQYNGVNDDGSVNINIAIIDESKEAEDVLDAVYNVISIISDAGGKSATAYPVIDNLNVVDYMSHFANNPNYSLDENGYYYVDINRIGDLGTIIASALTYNENNTDDQWFEEIQKVLGIDDSYVPYTLGELVGMNDVKVLAKVESDNGSIYEVAYVFSFVK